ncbi:helix-turn-helix domain-containing protein [Pedobacter punctiformis]|uniref:Helix-turn-helix transcriptional regulator n=1 Tax=Pedobacter punctiformis TaxID=3004097 RepID=A0ABT4LAQ4_9SPHI|nr:helix-turn-helix transcriptional regulator [Pedobacter sp. HCMS5-2]MCZ4244946.1 helix-turn-helix transcriptional regulator [Pedobacter sp. HCMS5-2]
MKKLDFIIEKGADGYGAYREEKGLGLITTMGDTVAEVRDNIVDAYNLFAEEVGKEPITKVHIKLKYDLASFFEFYKEINVSALGKRIDMQKSLLSDYKNGNRKPSDKQVKKILTGIKELGKELSELELV